jgi:hypothetical protein
MYFHDLLTYAYLHPLAVTNTLVFTVALGWVWPVTKEILYWRDKKIEIEKMYIETEILREKKRRQDQ